MTALPPTFVALLLAYCFAAAGDLLLNRRSTSLFEWNQSLLVGLSIAATWFFPLSIILPANALLLTLVCLIAAGAIRCFSFQRAEVFEGLRKTTRIFRRGWLPSILLLLIGLLIVQFHVQNLRMSHQWDGYQIWATKALLIYHDGALGKKWLAPGFERILDYPPMVPLYEALVSKVRGEFDWNAVKPVFEIFYVSMLVSTFYATRVLVSRPIALGATALLALAPAVSTRSNVGGYADMPQAALVAGLAGALLGQSSSAGIGWRSPIPWLIGGLIMVKSEGMILALIACATVAIYWFLTVGLLAECRRRWMAIAVVGCCVAVRWLSLLWVQSHDNTYGPIDRAHLLRAYQNLLLVPRMCSPHLLNISEWGVFWPAFLVSAAALALDGAPRERALVYATLASLTAYTSIFYFTNWELVLHIHQAYSRLLVQIAPLAAIGIAAAYARLSGYSRLE